ncbi:MAG: pentapeptide repeat-containing protein [Nitrospinaceae bacterium]|jgi:uncharacterized protein YjbI with pentapeptide repeats|nr:pentapeptide repeat-containing protein [Nitrospinaceae bacterium]MBT3819829.1 pentapeptide repeat-containing protein [Nitrospinaceae bacterium]MBT4093360.1 pentapeptide repeat-containing protein [Nitrospinaceae bacterium]MBT4431323.1 pentapeptide repeat-containing protein [Nitrospinaceae bacterium]MBT5367556.1 pentapeptide repeat-containing protein [Nitrospinaceae bacterium]
MANPEHLDTLKQGAIVWNKWRGENPNIRPDLSGAFLYEGNLNGLDLTGANLDRVKCEGASFLGAKLRGASLRDANLQGVTGLTGGQFAGTDVSFATIPSAVKDFENSLKTVEETSKNARKIFFAMLLGCAYAALTILSTDDAKLITNSATSPLPIIQTAIPIANFFYVAPIVLLAIYFYFHLYMQNLWEELSELPARFPDGKPLDKKAYPWLLNRLVRLYIPMLQGKRLLFPLLQSGVSMFLSWWTVPLITALFWLWYLRVHDFVGTGWHIFYLFFAVLIAIGFQRTARNTFREEPSVPIRKIKWPLPFAASIAAISTIVVFAFSWFAINGLWFEPFPIRLVGLRNYVVLTNKEVSTKPPNWDRDKSLRALRAEVKALHGTESAAKGSSQKYVGLDLIIGAQLEEADLRYAEGFKAFFAGAHLVDADLRGANLAEANLAGADLKGANLERMQLTRANLEGSVLRAARLVMADITLANLAGADLRWANLEGASLLKTNLAGADLEGADLYKTNLRGVDLSRTIRLAQEQVDSAYIDENTKLPDYLKSSAERKKKTPETK